MKNYFVHPHGDIYSGGPTIKRCWTPLDFLNSIALFQEDNIHAELIYPGEIENYVNEKKTRFFISTTSLDLWQCPPLHIRKSFFQLCQRLASKGELYISGYHGTLLPEWMLKQTGARAIIRGEPEGTIRLIGNDNALEKIPGITYLRGTEIVSQPQHETCDLMEFPTPAYEQVDFNRYRYDLMGWERFALFETSRGCPYNCDFCSKNLMYGGGMRYKSVTQVQEELESAVVKHGVKTGYIFDLNFLSDKKRAIQICEYLIEKSYPFEWCCQTRLDNVDENIIKLLHNAGCKLIHYGVESYQHVQDGLKYKKAGSESINKTIQMTENLGIKTLCFYMIGFEQGCLNQNDWNTLKMMHTLKSSFASLHRYYDFSNKEFVKNRMISRKVKLHDIKIAAVIFFNLLRYYLHPIRIRNFLLQENKPMFFRRIWFFMKTIRRNPG